MSKHKHVSFVADLHLFTRRSDAPRYLKMIRRAAAQSTDFVLGGDIFDFRWSTLGSGEATVEAATHWLEELASSHPECHIHYLLGNHDYYGRFLDQLEKRAGAIPNLTWHRFYLRLGNSIFLHGDAARRKMTPEKLIRFRSRWLHVGPAGPLRNRAYDLLMGTGLHRPIPYLVHSSNRRLARRLSAYLEHVGEGPHTGVRNVYFGHIHRRMADYSYHGMTFHNGGAPIRGQPFHILQATVS
jgi:UDP-2,3-diacylglucosamine pyrophosphatase LpxH